jgi:hypothetical protein
VLPSLGITTPVLDSSAGSESLEQAKKKNRAINAIREGIFMVCVFFRKIREFSPIP